MKIEASSINELIENSGDKKNDLIQLDKIMMKVNSLFERWLYTNHTYTMIAYGKLTIDPNYPLFCLAPQKNYISLYIFNCGDEDILIHSYRNKLGKVSTGKYCIKISNFDGVIVNKLIELLSECNLRNQQEIDL